MEESALDLTNCPNSEADFQKTKVFILKLIDMLNDKNVSMEEVFQFIASQTSGVTAKDVEYDFRSQMASTFTDWLNCVDEVLLKVSNKVDEEADTKE